MKSFRNQLEVVSVEKPPSKLWVLFIKIKDDDEEIFSLEGAIVIDVIM